MKNFEFKISEEDNNIRLDKYLASVLEGKSRSYIQKVIENNKVTINGKIVKSNYKLKNKDVLSLDIEEPEEFKAYPENIPLDILYEDEDIIVVNKPQGMVVHPAPGSYNGTMVNALLYNHKNLSGINGNIRPGIVHRIDKDTSGVLVVAKNDDAHIVLAKQLKDHSMKREYYALVEGVIKDDKGTINEPLARHPKERIKISVVKDGREAITHFSVIERFEKYTLVKCILETGRTHQIRVHMAYIGHPLVGDPIYGYKKQRFKLKGQMLHAKTLGFIHPSTKKYMEFDSTLPDYFIQVLNKLKVSSL